MKETKEQEQEQQTMQLITKELEQNLPRLYETENTKTDEKILYIRYIAIYSNWEWYLCEYDPEKKLAFGYVISGLGEDCNEWGYFSLEEFEQINTKNLQIIRDENFSPITFEQLQKRINHDSNN